MFGGEFLAHRLLVLVGLKGVGRHAAIEVHINVTGRTAADGGVVVLIRSCKIEFGQSIDHYALNGIQMLVAAIC